MTFQKQTMGVMNITPNSFSDGGRHLGPQAMAQTLERFQKLHVKYLDVGAESTAPMNEAISFQEEWLRLQTFLNVLSEHRWHGVVSLDSYRPKTAFSFFKELKRLGYSEDQMLWNDISGSLDEEVEAFLVDFPNARYVFCHNLAPSREEASSHMGYTNEDNSNEKFLGDLIDFFKRGLAEYAQYSHQIILDPCFGFSKTYEQNLYLLDQFSGLLEQFKGHSWVYGISKKSFLRKWWAAHIEDGNREFLLQKSEFLHLHWLQKVASKLGGFEAKDGLPEMIFRVHEPSLVTFLDHFPK